MKILHVGYSDILGGAAISMNRLHKAMLSNGINSEALVLKKLNNDYLGLTHKYINPNELNEFLLSQSYTNSNLLFMSSGNYASLDLDNLIKKISSSE